MSRDTKYCMEYKNFAGAAHVIPPDNYSSSHSFFGPSPYKIRESTSPSLESSLKTRRSPSITQLLSSDKTREPYPAIIPGTDADFQPLRSSPLSSKFFKNMNTSTIQEDATIAATRYKQLHLITIHETLGHLSFATLKLMTQCSLISKDLANVDPPICPGCVYGKSRCRQWRHKGIRNRKTIHRATSTGAVVSVDQLVNLTPSFFPIHRGIPTTKRYIITTIFVYHSSDLTYCQLMAEMNGKTTVASKDAFERMSTSHNVKIIYYHCDNGIFDTNVFQTSI